MRQNGRKRMTTYTVDKAFNHEDLVILNLNAYNFNTYKAKTETQGESAKSP